MRNYIINAPQLQSASKRAGSMGITLICWAMWGYLLFPIVTLVNWLRGDYNVINEMRWFGGYKSLLELMEMYVGTLIILGVAWFTWILIRKLSKRPLLNAAKSVVTQDEQADFYHVDKTQIVYFQQQQNVTVFFDELGQITHLEPS